MTFKQQLSLAEKHLSESDKLMKPIIKARGQATFSPHTDYYGQLIRSIVGQQLSVKAAVTIWQRLLDLFDGKTPLPEELLDMDAEILRKCGFSYAKVAYVKDLAEHILDGRLDMAHITKLPNDELIQQLTAVKGIGVWSAHMFMIFSLGRLDILPVGDLGVRKAAMNIYGLEALPDVAALQKIAADNSWSPYESVAAWYLWQSLNNDSK